MSPFFFQQLCSFRPRWLKHLSVLNRRNAHYGSHELHLSSSSPRGQLSLHEKYSTTSSVEFLRAWKCFSEQVFFYFQFLGPPCQILVDLSFIVDQNFSPSPPSSVSSITGVWPVWSKRIRPILKVQAIFVLCSLAVRHFYRVSNFTSQMVLRCGW